MRIFKKTAFMALALSMAMSCTAFASGIEVRDIEGEVSYHTELQKEAIADSAENILNYGVGEEENSRPEGVVISWTFEGEAPEGFTVSLSLNDDMSDALSFESDADAQDGIYSENIKNLYIGKTYYYTVTENSTGEVSDIHSFDAALELPRNMEVDGVTNVRDMGGWPLANGGHERQGMVYRGGRLNQNESDEIMITEEGKHVMLDIMGIKSEIDFRTTDNNENGNITVSPLGESVAYYSMPWNASSISKASDMIRDIMLLFADEANYPIYFHCSIGTDRTGFIAAVLHGLLGVAEEDIYKDYVFSNLGVIETTRELKNMKNRVEKNIKVQEGSTLQEQTRNYLLSIGLTDEQIDSIVSIMTE